MFLFISKTPHFLFMKVNMEQHLFSLIRSYINLDKKIDKICNYWIGAFILCVVFAVYVCFSSSCPLETGFFSFFPLILNLATHKLFSKKANKKQKEAKKEIYNYLENNPMYVEKIQLIEKILSPQLPIRRSNKNISCQTENLIHFFSHYEEFFLMKEKDFQLLFQKNENHITQDEKAELLEKEKRLLNELKKIQELKEIKGIVAKNDTLFEKKKFLNASL